MTWCELDKICWKGSIGDFTASKFDLAAMVPWAEGDCGRSGFLDGVHGAAKDSGRLPQIPRHPGSGIKIIGPGVQGSADPRDAIE